MSKILREDLSDFQIREKSFPWAAEIQIGSRITKPMKQRLTKLGMAHGMNESQLCRFLLTTGLAQYGIEFSKAK